MAVTRLTRFADVCGSKNWVTNDEDKNKKIWQKFCSNWIPSARFNITNDLLCSKIIQSFWKPWPEVKLKQAGKTTLRHMTLVLNCSILKKKRTNNESFGIHIIVLWNGNTWEIPSLLRYCGRPTKGQTTFPSVPSLAITRDEDAHSPRPQNKASSKSLLEMFSLKRLCPLDG